MTIAAKLVTRTEWKAWDHLSRGYYPFRGDPNEANMREFVLINPARFQLVRVDVVETHQPLRLEPIEETGSNQ